MKIFCGPSSAASNCFHNTAQSEILKLMDSMSCLVVSITLFIKAFTDYFYVKSRNIKMTFMSTHPMVSAQKEILNPLHLSNS